MWTLLVVILPPIFDLSPCIAQTREPVGIQAFVSQSAVEALSQSVLCRLARLNKFQTHAALFAPRRQRSPAKLRPVIETGTESYRFRRTLEVRQKKKAS
jgi:hypothetical protein